MTQLNDRFEILLLKCLFFKENLTRKSIAFLKSEYFEDSAEKAIFEEYKKFFDKYDKLPTKEVILIKLSTESGIKEDVLSSAKTTLEKLENNIEDVTEDYFVNASEKWCQDRALYNAVLESAVILQDDTGKKSRGTISELVSNALAVTFDNRIGHDYIRDAQERFEYYHNTDEKLAFDMKTFNAITLGGIPKKTLNIILAGPHTGKSLMMCHFASSYLLAGKNVLYVTLELSEKQIAQRIDANLFDVQMNDVKEMPHDIFAKKIKDVSLKTLGTLKIREYPTNGANVNHIKALLQELKSKNKFVPDVLFVDYLNIASAASLSDRGNMYLWAMTIGAELRGLAVSNNLICWSATQVNRSGHDSSDVSMANISESFGVNAIADFMVALMVNDQQKKLGQIFVKQLKNRYHDLSFKEKFFIGVDRLKMKIYDLEEVAQERLSTEANESVVEIKRKEPGSIFKSLRDKARKIDMS